MPKTVKSVKKTKRQTGAKKTTRLSTDKLVKTLWVLTADKGWDDVTLVEVAKKMRIPLHALAHEYPDKKELLPLLVADISQTANKRPLDPTLPPREAWFEFLMARFDALQEKRSAVLSIHTACMHDWDSFLVLGESVRQNLIKDKSNAPSFPKNIQSFTTIGTTIGLYVAAFYAWKKDETKDLSKTMVFVDKGADIMQTVLSFRDTKE